MTDVDFVDEVDEELDDDSERSERDFGSGESTGDDDSAVMDEGSAVIAVGLEKPEKVKEGLAKFFKDLHWAVGGSIPEDILFSEKYVNLIVNLGNSGRGFVNAVDAAYPFIEAHAKEYGSFARSGPYVSGLEIEICLYVVHRLGRLNIPQGYLGGIFLIYLELCEGVKLR